MEDFFEKNVSLERYTTMRVKGVADYLFKARTIEDLIKALVVARKKNLPYFFLGAGSNTVFSCRYEGVVILMKMDGIEVEEKEKGVYVSAEAGAFLPQVARKVTEKRGVGMEWAAGVPGTIGGAVRGNAGAFNTFINSFLEKVDILDIETLKRGQLDGKECISDYRESIFKKRKNLLILKAELFFPYGEEGEEKMNQILGYRKENHPLEPSAGSFFKNPKADLSLFKRFPEMEKFKEKGFIPAAFLIERCNMKGRSVGGAQVSKKHANFIINKGGATGEDVIQLSEEVKKKVKEKFGVLLEKEVEIVC